jgi:hypothetical protein
MPITRRRRANPPDQPENNNHLADQTENAAEVLAAELEPPLATEPTNTNTNENNVPSLQVPAAPEPEAVPEQAALPEAPSYAPMAPAPAPNGDRGNGERAEGTAHPSHGIEGGRRTARGELFRRPPVPPAIQPPAPPPVQLQPPSHEIVLPLGRHPGDIRGDPLHLAYNPGYTGADEMRALLLHRLAQESKAGGRARCWNCGSVAIVYDRWNTRSKTFGEIGIAFCEVCGVWSVM